MAAPVKEKNMPTISANIYGGLQKWVNRASISLRGRRRSRTNSVASMMTSYDRTRFQNMSRQSTDIIPVHGRSRSNPVPMPDILTFESDHQKIPHVNKRLTKQPSECSDDSSSRGSLHDVNDMPVYLNKGLSNTLSKSESNLLGGERNTRRCKTISSIDRNNRHRKCSQETTVSLDSNLSELDINDGNRKSRSSQTLNRTNKRDKRHSADSIGTNNNEQPSTSTKHVDEKSKNIHSRLDMWLEKTNGFRDSRQSSLDSNTTSSSDEIFYESHNKSRREETKHFRDLQTALDELVSSCGTRNAKGTPENTNINKRKISMNQTGSMFNKSIDCDSLQERQMEYKMSQCGSSSDSGVPKDIQLDEENGSKIDETCEREERSDLESSYDSYNDIIDGRDGFHEVDSSKDGIHDIGPTTFITRVVNSLNDDAFNQTEENINSTNHTIVSKHPQSHSSTSSPGSASKEKKFSFENKENLRPKPDRSPKRFHAPHPPVKGNKNKNSTTVVFDDDLAAFERMCVEASKSLEREDKRGRSDSDDEKKTALSLDYVYIPKNVKSATHPKSSYDDKVVRQRTLSDDESYIVTSKNKDSCNVKNNSQDSLDGFVLFESINKKDIDYESKSLSSNESTKDTDKNYLNGFGELRKFPSMPMFYVPNDGTRKSIKKSLWSKIKSLPRSTDARASVTQKPKHLQHSTQPDPFYHGDQDQEIRSRMRPKSNSVAMAPGEDRKTYLKRRLSVEMSLSPPNSASAPAEGSVLSKNIIETEPQDGESQC